MHYYVFILALSYINTTIYKLKTIGLNDICTVSGNTANQNDIKLIWEIQTMKIEKKITIDLLEI